MNQKVNNVKRGRNAEATVLTMLNKWSGGQFRRSGYGQKGGDIILKAESTWKWPYTIEVKAMEYRPEQVGGIFVGECEKKDYSSHGTLFIYRYRHRLWVAMPVDISVLLGSIWGEFRSLNPITITANIYGHPVLDTIELVPLKDLLNYMIDPQEHFGGGKAP